MKRVILSTLPWELEKIFIKISKYKRMRRIIVLLTSIIVATNTYAGTIKVKNKTSKTIVVAILYQTCGWSLSYSCSSGIKGFYTIYPGQTESVHSSSNSYRNVWLSINTKGYKYNPSNRHRLRIDSSNCQRNPGSTNASNLSINCDLDLPKSLSVSSGTYKGRPSFHTSIYFYKSIFSKNNSYVFFKTNLVDSGGTFTFH